MTREKRSGQILVTSAGELDDAAVHGILRAIDLTPEETPIVIDFSRAQLPSAHSLRLLAAGLAQRSGPVSFRGPSWAQALSTPR